MRFNLLLIITFSLFKGTLCICQEDLDTLFFDDFENGTTEKWNLHPMWNLNLAEENYYLTGKEHTWANIREGYTWTDYTLSLSFV